MLKIARDFEPTLGEPRRARRASVSISFRASRGRIGWAKIGKFDIGGIIQLCSNIF